MAILTFWAEDLRRDRVGKFEGHGPAFFRGIIIAVPISLALWALIISVAFHLLGSTPSSRSAKNNAPAPSRAANLERRPTSSTP